MIFACFLLHFIYCYTPPRLFADVLAGPAGAPRWRSEIKY